MTTNNGQRQQLITTRVVFLDAQAMHFDEKGYIEQRMLHSDLLGISTAVPPHRTERLKWPDSERPPVADGSEWVISDTPPPPDHDTQADFVNAGLDIVFMEHQAGNTREQILDAMRAGRLRFLLYLTCFILIIIAFVVLPFAYPAEDDAAQGGTNGTGVPAEAQAPPSPAP